MGSNELTITRNRGLKAFKKLYDESSKIKENGIKSENNIENLKIRIGEVLKFYPGSDKVLVKFKDKTERCLEAHTVVSDEINISWTPVGYQQFDEKYSEPSIVPISRFNAIVLDIRGEENINENCVIAYVSLDNQKILNNAFPGELKLQYYDSSITLKQTGVYIEGDAVLINNKQLTHVIGEKMEQNNYTYEELNNILSDIEERLSKIENNS